MFTINHFPEVVKIDNTKMVKFRIQINSRCRYHVVTSEVLSKLWSNFTRPSPNSA